MAEGVVVHREQVSGTGTWSPRPPALAGETPVAVVAFGRFLAAGADGVTQANATFFQGFSDGINARSIANYQADALASTSTIVANQANGLAYCVDPIGTDQFELGIPSFVPGGFDVPIVTNLTNPEVVCLFFYGSNWQAFIGSVRVTATVGGTVTLDTGFTGTNENQIVFTLPCLSDRCTSITTTDPSSCNFGFGVAVRQGASSVPIGQASWSGGPRAAWGTSQIGQAFSNIHIHTPATRANLNALVECTAIRDNEVDFTTRFMSSRRGIFVLAIATGDKKCWAGELNPPTVNGNWTVNDPNFQPVIAGLSFSQSQLQGTFEDSDIAIGGNTVGTANSEHCVAWSDQDNVSTMVAKTRANNRFLDVLQDDGSEGWKAGASDFSLTSTGWQVSNLVVDGGGGGAPLTSRKWIGWAIEGEGAGPVPDILDIDDLIHAHPMDSPDVSGNYALGIPDLDHAHPVDQCAVIEVGANFPLNITDLDHVHPVDEANVTSGIFLDIDKLSHAHPVESPTLTVLVTPLDIDDLIHAHPVDEVNLGGNYPLGINDLTHAHPVDEVALGAMEGDLTALIGETDRWSANAGVELNNTQGADLNWHVVEVMFDGVNTSIAIDGVEVKGDAGIRALAALTIGAEMDGSNRFNGNLGELRIYSGAMTGPERLAIRNELTTKWITG